MSETVHYRGIATKVEQPKDKTLIQVAEDILKGNHTEIEDYYKDAIECLCDVYYKQFFFHTKTKSLYKLDNNEYEADDDIIKAEPKRDGTIEYELRYYNGGAGFNECLEEAFDSLNTQ